MIENIEKLNKELQSISEKYTTSQREFPHHKAFILWYLSYSKFDSMDEAFKHICDSPGDKGIDASYINEEDKTVVLVQSKYHFKGKFSIPSAQKECRELKNTIEKIKGNDIQFQNFLREVSNNIVRRKIKEARRFVKENHFKIEVIFITTYKINKNKKKSIEKNLKTKNVKPIIFSREDILGMVEDWEAGVAPYIREVKLPVEKSLYRKSLKGKGSSVIIFSTKGNNLSNLYRKYQDKIFARNIRLYLGENQINKEIESTIKDNPKNFFYLNNGISIICDGYKIYNNQLKIFNCQIINGQQTIRALSNQPNSKKADVLVRVIKVDRKKYDKYEDLISKIVCGTNRQNPIDISDLMSNDSKQVKLQENFRRKGYLYIRKNQNKRDARNDWKRRMGKNELQIIKKEDLAQYLCATQSNPILIRQKGKKALFKKEIYEELFKYNDFSYYELHMYLGQFIEKIAKGQLIEKISRENKRKKAHWLDARWIVMSIFWDRNCELLSKKGKRETIIDAFKKDDRFKKSLAKVLKKLFDYANKTYLKRKKEIKGGRKSRNDFFARTDCKKWTEQMIAKRELNVLEKKMKNELHDFWNKRFWNERKKVA